MPEERNKRVRVKFADDLFMALAWAPVAEAAVAMCFFLSVIVSSHFHPREEAEIVVVRCTVPLPSAEVVLTPGIGTTMTQTDRQQQQAR